MRALAALLAVLLPGHALATACTTHQDGTLACDGRELSDRVWAYDVSNFGSPTAPAPYSCSVSNQAGGEAFYRFDCPYTGRITVELVNPICDLDVFVLTDACTGSACVARNTVTIPNDPNRDGVFPVSFDCTLGDTMWVVVEAYGPWYDWSLSNPDCGFARHPQGRGPAGYSAYADFQLRAICAEDCADGFDNDRDGPIDCLDPDCAGTADCCDRDGDGVNANTAACGLGGDCDDDDPAIRPGAPEVPVDGIDQDCDGADDCYQDLDLDGFGTPTVVRGNNMSCTDLPGESADARDCQDTGAGAATRYPGAPELVGDGIDQDCDGVDTCWRDADGDGWGRSAQILGDDLTCADSPGRAARDGDCNDASALVNPDADEVCNADRDDDCDGRADDADDDVVGAPTWYPDADADGFGASTGAIRACLAPAGHVASSTDCDDARPAVNPGADEVCNGRDDDCDALVDDADPDRIGAPTWWLDADRDGYAGGATSVAACVAPAHHEATPSDCDDARPAVNPGADEVCNGRDDDCDALADDADLDLLGAPTWWQDRDGDGFAGALGSTTACVQPPGHEATVTDCDDRAIDVNPDADEVCNGRDDDCDALVDDADTLDVLLTAWADADRDGYGDPGAAQQLNACAVPDGWSDDPRDCDDTSALTSPEAVEVPYDGIDQDCTGADLTDVDGDGAHGGPLGADCLDTDPLRFPGAAERPDGIDQDCDGVVDEGTDRFDDDGDGVTERGGDCDDADPARAPGRAERADGRDDDCDGVVDEGTDRFDDDGDGYSEEDGDCNDADPAVSPAAVELPGNGVDDDCDGQLVGAGAVDADRDGYAPTGGDCDDADPRRRPGAAERPNGLDDDCDGVVDEGTDLYDDDGDGVSERDGDCDDAEVSVVPGAPELPDNHRDDDCDGVTDDAGDCDDADPDVRPWAAERVNGRDDDCDGVVDEGADDADLDGWTRDEGDCNDAEGWANPERDEVCDGIDNDCDEQVDEGCAQREAPVEEAEAPRRGCASAPAPGGLPIALLGLLAARRARRGRAAL